MKLKFFGAAREVGRSCIMVEGKNTRILLDAGVKIGEEEAELPTLPDSMLKSIDAVVITHAHLDHCGYLPHLYSNGFNGLAYALKPTFELVNVIANDYLKISEPKNISKDWQAKMQRKAKVLEYHQEARIKDFAIKFVPAGHILGSAMVEVRLGDERILYTGDLNLRTTRLLDPAYTEYLKADTLITESTYGGDKDTFPAEKEVLSGLMKSIKTTLENEGKVVIPSFAVGRAQEVLFILDDYMRSGTLPKVPIFVDGMIGKANRIYRHNVIFCKDELQKRILMSEDDPFKSSNFSMVEDKADRSKVMRYQGAAIVVTTSGMLKGGPVIKYLEHMGSDALNKLILVGYQAVGTPGRDLLNGAKEISLEGKKIKMGLKVESFHLSAHADRPQLVRFVSKIQGLKRIFIVHGDEEKMKQLAAALGKHYKVTMPVLNEECTI